MTTRERIAWFLVSVTVCFLLLGLLEILAPPRNPWDLAYPMRALLFVFYASTCLLLFVPLLVRRFAPTATPSAITSLLCLTLLVVLMSCLLAGFSDYPGASGGTLITCRALRHVCIVFGAGLGVWTLWSATQFVLFAQQASGWRVKTACVLIVVHLFACGSMLICAGMIDSQLPAAGAAGGLGFWMIVE